VDDLIQFLRARLDEDYRTATDDGVLAGDTWHVLEPLPGRVTAEVMQIGGPVAKLEHRAAEHMARHDPARVVAEVAAKRQIIELHGHEERSGWRPDDDDTPGAYGTIEQACMECGSQDLAVRWPCPTIRLLALPYVDHPQYQESWKP
jgi:hypothetical protein